MLTMSRFKNVEQYVVGVHKTSTKGNGLTPDIYHLKLEPEFVNTYYRFTDHQCLLDPDIDWHRDIIEFYELLSC